MDLQGQIGDKAGIFRGIELAHGRLLAVRLPCVVQVCRPVDQPFGRLGLGGHICDIPLQTLKSGDGLAELHALVHVFDGKINGALRNAHSLGACANAGAVQRHHCHLKALPRTSHQISGGYAAVLKDQLRRLAAAESHFVLHLAHGKAGRTGLHDDGRHALQPFLWFGEGENDEYGGAAAAGDEALCAVEHILICVGIIDGGSAGGGRVGAGVRLCQRKGRHLAALGQAGQIFFLLLFCSKLRQNVGRDEMDRQRRRRGHALFGKLGNGNDLLHTSAADAAVFHRHADTGIAVTSHEAECVHGKRMGIVNGGGAWLQLVFRKLTSRLLQQLLGLGERKIHRRLLSQ